MPETLVAEPPPFVADADGVMRVRGTRVTVDTILAAFALGSTAEQIVQQYPSLALADAYQVIGYYLRHSTELDAYLAKRRLDHRDSKRLNESRWPPEGIRDRLLGRR